MTDELSRQIISWLQAHPVRAEKPEYYGQDEQPR